MKPIKFIGLLLGISIFLSCHPENPDIKSKNRVQCEKEILSIETFNKIILYKLSLADSLYLAMKHRDSLLTTLVFPDSSFAGKYTPNKLTQLQLDTFIEKTINETSCLKYKKGTKQLKKSLISIKQSEINCDNFLVQLNHLTTKDSLLRKKLGLNPIPYKTLIKIVSNTNQEYNLKMTFEKQIDKKINELLIYMYYITRSQDEIIKNLSNQG